MELLADRDPEEAREVLDPVLERMMEAVHRYEGTVNQVMGDGIMALFGAPLAHEDHAVRACFAALRIQESLRRYTDEARRSHGVEIQVRIGLNSGEVVVRSVGSDLRMDYSAVGQTTHLAARMEQMAPPGTVRPTNRSSSGPLVRTTSPRLRPAGRTLITHGVPSSTTASTTDAIPGWCTRDTAAASCNARCRARSRSAAGIAAGSMTTRATSSRRSTSSRACQLRPAPGSGWMSR